MKFFGKKEDKMDLQAAYDEKLEEALSAQVSGDLKKGDELLKQSQQIFVKWAEEVKEPEA